MTDETHYVATHLKQLIKRNKSILLLMHKPDKYYAKLAVYKRKLRKKGKG